jgi:DNA polymerase III delta prime subunit
MCIGNGYSARGRIKHCMSNVKDYEGMDTGTGYVNALDHLFDEMRLLDLRLLKTLRIRQGTIADEPVTKGLFVAFEEVESLLTSADKDLSHPVDPDIVSLDNFIREGRESITAKLAHGGNSVNAFPIVRLERMFGLNPFEVGMIVMAFAVEADKKYERIHAYFNDDLTKKLPSVATALDAFCRNEAEKLHGWRHVSPDSPLLFFNLIRFAEDHADSSFLSRRFRLDERIKRFMVGDNGLQEGLLPVARLYFPHGALPAFHAHAAVKEKIVRHIMHENSISAGKQVFWLFGKAHEEKKAVVRAVCEEINLPLITADIEDIHLESDQAAVIKNLFREAALQSAILFLEGGDRLYNPDEKSLYLRKTLLKTISQLSWVTVISAETLWMPGDAEGLYSWHPLEFSLPGFSERKRIWQDALSRSRLSVSDIDSLAGRFTFSESRINNIVLQAALESKADGAALDAIYHACSAQSRQSLEMYAARVPHHYIWNDIVLPEDRTNQLREVCDYIKHKHLVYFSWGFEKKLALGRGLNVLFSGPSGTGKTMAADIIASEFRLDMFKVDLSSLVSKYIGETEKNLNRIFREAESGNIVLFFDEADALFGKRSEVKDAHDRYANIEINYLLQKMEEHEGIVILATNLSKNLDEAFLRRMHFTVEFPFPDEKQRALIWKKIFPEKAPLSDDINITFLASRFKLAGGNIKNIALSAAFYAAEESSDIRMRHIILAAKREYQKMGKLCVKGDFGEYYDLIKEGAGT